MAENNTDRQIVKDLDHMREHLQVAQTHINLVENFLLASIKREEQTRRKNDKNFNTSAGT